MPKLKFTLKAWPVIAGATIGLCYLTQLVGGWLGFDLKEQTTIVQMRQMGFHAWQLLSAGNFRQIASDKVALAFLFNIPAVLAVMPVVEEFVFRWLLFRWPCRLIDKRTRGTGGSRRDKNATICLAIAASILFSAAHYIQMPWPNNAFIALFFFGLAQCGLYRKTERIWCAMLNHGLFNLTNLVLLFVIPE